ncbi:pilus assembly protein TadG-related protein [Beijerinckia sp. L45]|uniref:pilus assembly protein TadG-related protein n=1 Tax=Beijerinckia sp. L45 TaxID=1641855 RepID=UPI00131D97E5|nr:pilus assembly protein TadG-related protein [Beijerinckia sp. L45]
MLFSLVRSFLRRRDGTVSIIGAVALPMLVAFASLVVEFGHGLLAKAEIQRVADMASYAGGLAYASNGSTTSMIAAAQNVALLNGIPASAVSVRLITSPKNASDQAVFVSIAKTQLLLLAPVVNFSSSVPIVAKSYAQLGVKTNACVIALGTTAAGISISGSTSITAPACAVASNANVTAPCGTSISDVATTYGGALSAGCSNVIGAKSQATVTDPLAGNAGVSALTTHLAAVNSLASPLAPTVASVPTVPAVTAPAGVDLVFGSSILTTPATTLSALLAQLCVAVGLFNQWVVTCPLNTTVSFGNVTVQNGVTVTFNPGTILPTTYNFNGQIVNNGTIIFGPGIFNITQGVTTSYGSTTTFGIGTFNIAQTVLTSGGSVVFGPGTYNIAQGVSTTGGSVTFGAGTYNVAQGISTTGGSATFGAGTYNVAQGISTSGGATASFGAGTYTIAQGVSTGGGSTTTFGAGTFTIGQSVSTAGGATTAFGAGAFTIAQGVYTAGGGTTTFGAGSFAIGQGTTACTGAGKYSICNLGTTTFAGPSMFLLSSGIYNTGGSTLLLGANTTTNSFQVGASSDGYALYVGGGSTTTFGDATTGLFQMAGNIYAPQGGSCMTFSKAAQHDINGSVATAGGTIFGSGIYTVSGYIGMGYANGGNTTCNGVSVGATGTDVTFVTGAASTMASANCPSAAFCISSGFNNVSLSAPTTGPYANLLIVGPTTYNTGGIALTEGYGGSTLNGAIYFPYGPMTLAGSAGMAPAAGRCLQVIASQINFSGSGNMSAATCFSGSASAWNVALVQ